MRTFLAHFPNLVTCFGMSYVQFEFVFFFNCFLAALITQTHSESLVFVVVNLFFHTLANMCIRLLIHSSIRFCCGFFLFFFAFHSLSTSRCKVVACGSSTTITSNEKLIFDMHLLSINRLC